MLTPANRDHGPKLRRLLVGQDGLRRSQTLARIDRLGRWRTLFFQEDWLRESTNTESYLMDHDIARCRLFGVEKFDDLFNPWSSLSLKDQGWLDKPSCPMLIVNGKEDLQTPIADRYILLEYGCPKSARIFAGGHMGQTPETFPTIVNWLKNELS
jgi:hypothetical protein